MVKFELLMICNTYTFTFKVVLQQLLGSLLLVFVHHRGDLIRKGQVDQTTLR